MTDQDGTLESWTNNPQLYTEGTYLASLSYGHFLFSMFTTQLEACFKYMDRNSSKEKNQK
jgi:hypothetical protein